MIPMLTEKKCKMLFMLITEIDIRLLIYQTHFDSTMTATQQRHQLIVLPQQSPTSQVLVLESIRLVTYVMRLSLNISLKLHLMYWGKFCVYNLNVSSQNL